MDHTLEHNLPAYQTPEMVTLGSFQIGRPDKDTQWQLGGNGDTWTPPPDWNLSDMLVWLDQHGYKPIGGTEPPQFRRKPVKEFRPIQEPYSGQLAAESQPGKATWSSGR